MDNFFYQEPYGDFDLVSSSERLFREVDPDEFLQSNENNNTRKKNMYDMKLAYLMFKNETRLIQYIPPDELNNYLCNFILAVTKKMAPSTSLQHLEGLRICGQTP